MCGDPYYLSCGDRASVDDVLESLGIIYEMEMTIEEMELFLRTGKEAVETYRRVVKEVVRQVTSPYKEHIDHLITEIEYMKEYGNGKTS